MFNCDNILDYGPIANVCIAKEHHELVDFESFFTHTIYHECCHGFGPHSIILPSGQKSIVILVSVIIGLIFRFCTIIFVAKLVGLFTTSIEELKLSYNVDFT